MFPTYPEKKFIYLNIVNFFLIIKLSHIQITGETAALASVGAAAVTAGYHVTLEPCASAPPIIPLPAAGVVDGATDDVQQSAAGDNNNLPSSPPTCSSSRHQQCTPPPGFRQQQAAVPNEDGRSGANGPSNDANNQQHAAGGKREKAYITYCICMYM